MERDIVFGHELDVSHVVGTFVFTPPAFPITACGISPFGGCSDIFDRCVEPNVENFAIHVGPVVVSALDRNTPVQIPGDATILQAVPVVEPLLGNRCRQDRPIGFAIDPLCQLASHR